MSKREAAAAITIGAVIGIIIGVSVFVARLEADERFDARLVNF